MDYIHINQNDFLHRKHKKHREEDVAICVYKYDANDPDRACGETCLNKFTSTDALLVIALVVYVATISGPQGGRFIIEYCGEVISLKDAKRRAQAYETLTCAGIKDAYIISLNAYESIDATRKGSLAIFINHSCQPNCKMRK
ncbi:hypothetical protein Nepgr_033512 [Nepenthes gracilis]|uniref:SET domain-containing protein n=1 Tax=Nepenthes gracilis TaxID=150966 RepID=A0AAD3TKR8_NEPGR|nr:hypothetical protein Nepgr_033512 [Nepenthes gracilis]